MIIDQDKKFKKATESFEGSYQVQDVFNTFIALYPEDWKQLK